MVFRKILLIFFVWSIVRNGGYWVFVVVFLLVFVVVLFFILVIRIISFFFLGIYSSFVYEYCVGFV